MSNRHQAMESNLCTPKIILFFLFFFFHLYKMEMRIKSINSHFTRFYIAHNSSSSNSSRIQIAYNVNRHFFFFLQKRCFLFDNSFATKMQMKKKETNQGAKLFDNKNVAKCHKCHLL